MQQSKDFLNLIYEKSKDKGKIDDGLIEYLDTIYLNKSQDILEVITRGISKYIYKPSNRTVWRVKGTLSDHLIYPKTFCTCKDFYKNVIILKKRGFCKHLIAQTISEAINNFSIVELEDNNFSELVKELKSNI